MNQYVNHFQCSRNNETGETIINFFQISPKIVVKPEEITTEGVAAEFVSSVVMSEDNARILIKVLSDVLK